MKMSVMRKACDLRFHKPIVGLLAIQLARHADDDNKVTIRQQDLASICGCSKPLLIESMKRLIEKGAVSVEHTREANGRKKTSVISLDFADH